MRHTLTHAVCWALCLFQSTSLAFSTTSSIPSSRFLRQHVEIYERRSRPRNLGPTHRPEPVPGVPLKAITRTKTSALFHQNSNNPQSPSRRDKLKLILANLRGRISMALKWGRRKAAIALFCLMMVFSIASGDALAKGTMGRSGGSFKSAPRGPPSSSSRVYSSPSRSYYGRPSGPRFVLRPPSTTHLFYSNPAPRPTIIIGSNYQPYGPQIRRGFRASDLILVTGSGLAIAYGVSTRLEKERRQNSSILGPGFSVAKLTVSLNVPDRDAPNSILLKLQQLSSMANTNSRKGVQDLVSSVALELMRQERSIRSAASVSEHYSQEGEAERSYFRQSIQERSKFDDEREHNYGSGESPQPLQAEDSKATEAVVTILIAIEGDSTKLPPIKSRDDVIDALDRLAVDAQMDDCLVSGEVSWAPDLRAESLTVDDIYVDYPTLYPI